VSGQSMVNITHCVEALIVSADLSIH